MMEAKAFCCMTQFPQNSATNSASTHLVNCAYMCPKLLNLTWLIHIPWLQSLRVEACDSKEAVIQDDESKISEIEQELGMFSTLRTLKFYNLPYLQSMCSQALPFPSLTSISVVLCPSLRKLPLDSKTST